MKSIVFFTVLLLASPFASATTLPRLPLDDLHKNAMVVAVVLIESGSIVMNGDRSCGIKYSGRILEAIKGPIKKGELIEFGPYRGQGIGNSALIFLNDSKNVYSPKASTNSIAVAQEAEYRKTCLSIMPKYSVMFEGLGLLEISWTLKFNEEAISFKDDWVATPPGLESKLREPGDNQIVSDEYWVKVKDVVTYLKNIPADKATKP